MKKVFKAFMAMVILALAYSMTFAATGNEMAAASVTVSMGVFSAIMYLSPMMKNMAFEVVVPLIPDFTEKSKEDVDKMSRDDFDAYMQEKGRHKTAIMKKEIHDQITEARKEDGDSEKLKDLETKMNALIDEQDHNILAMKAMSERMQNEKAIGLKAALIAKDDDIKKFLKAGEGKMEIEFEVKASQVPSDIGDREELGQWLSGIGQIPRRRTYIKDRVRVVPTNSEYIKYMDQATVVRDAKNVAHCAASTHNTKLTWTKHDLRIKKIRDFTDICIDMMEDYDFVEGEVRDLVDSSVALKCDNGLLLDDGTLETLNGIASYSSTFNPANPAANYALQIQAATLIDLIIVAGAQIAAFGEENSFMADTVYMNPRDYTLMKLLKDGEDNYIKQGEVDPRIFQDRNGRLWIDGVILVLPNPNVNQNEFYIFDSMKATIYERKRAMIELSYENRANFETETVTVKAYERLNMLVRNVNANAFMHVDDIAGGVTAITKP